METMGYHRSDKDVELTILQEDQYHVVDFVVEDKLEEDILVEDNLVEDSLVEDILEIS